MNMRFGFLVLFCCIAGILSVHDNSSFSNVDEIRQEFLDFELDIDFENQNISGLANIKFKALENVDKITLDSMNLNIKNVFLNNDALQWELDSSRTTDELGTPLVIELPEKLQKGNSVDLRIQYETTSKAASIQWMTPEMTSGKKLPFMYTQNESIGARSMIPCQDTPSVKTKMRATLKVDKEFTALFGGIRQSEQIIDNRKEYIYRQDIPIPTYLIAIAVGDLSYRKLGDKTGVWAEPSRLDAAAYEFEEAEKFVQTAESYLSEYNWKVFDILLLPPGFPFGGMENPNLTFVTPSLIAGDRSLANVIIHELAHSWTGNLVTNANWDNFWMNEGFTVFFERKMIQILYGNDMRHLHAQIGHSELQNDVESFGIDHKYTRLFPDVQNDTPDNSFSTVPYEKGFTFLYFLEKLIGEQNFQNIFRIYISENKFGSVTVENFRSVFEREVARIYPSNESDEIIDSVDWNSWIYTTGMPFIEFDFGNCIFYLESKYVEEAKKYSHVLLQEGTEIPSEFEQVYSDWMAQVKIKFLTILFEQNDKITDKGFDFLKNTLKLGNTQNMEVSLLWLRINLKRKEQTIKPAVADFLASIGRMKYIRPLYSDLYDLDSDFSKETFAKLKKLYHPMAIKLVEEDFAKKDKKSNFLTTTS